MDTRIINEDGVLRGAIDNTVIYGKGGAHATDLQKKCLLPEGTEKHTAHYLILPIPKIGGAVRELIGLGISKADMISFGGVMAKVPNGTPSVHALWGPVAVTNLKIAVAMETFGNGNVLMRKLLEKMTASGITIIETDKGEHDSKMGIIQGLINLWLIIVGEIDDTDIKTQLIEPWKTPVGTIIDMVHENFFAEKIIKLFFASLPKHGYNVSAALEDIINTHLTSEDLGKFGTPNSGRVINFISRTTGRIIVPRNSIIQLQEELNSYGDTSLAKRMTSIREPKK